jgi:hypothetical protein
MVFLLQLIIFSWRLTQLGGRSEDAITNRYTAVHIPAGEVRRLDEVLADIDEVTYAPMGAHHYM